MAPIFGSNFDSEDSIEDLKSEEDGIIPTGLTEMAFWYMIIIVSMLLTWLFVFFCLRILALRQKTRNPQQRRMYGSRQRPSLSPQEPTIYVSPSNLPPPPKYEAMAPPSYDEVVGIHSTYYQHTIQPIQQPITTAMAQSSNNTSTERDARDATVVTVTTSSEPRRTSVVVATTA